MSAILIEKLLQINHIDEFYAAFYNFAVVIVGKKILNDVRFCKSAVFVKRHGKRAVARADL